MSETQNSFFIIKRYFGKTSNDIKPEMESDYSLMSSLGIKGNNVSHYILVDSISAEGHFIVGLRQGYDYDIFKELEKVGFKEIDLDF